MTIVKNNPVHFSHLFDELFAGIPNALGKIIHRAFQYLPQILSKQRMDITWN